MAGVISFGSMLVALYVSPERLYLIPMCMVCSLIILAVWLYGSYKGNLSQYKPRQK
jgi:MFS superfamily sulfate permease-like transporter